MEAGVIFHAALMAAASFSLPLLFTRGFLVQFSCYHLSAELFLPTRFRGSTRNNDEEEEKKRRCCSRDSSFDFSAFSIWKYLDEEKTLGSRFRAILLGVGRKYRRDTFGRSYF